VTNSYVMKVSSNGQVSIPAEARTRWHSERVVVVDLGDRVVIRPLPDEPLEALVGKYRGVGPTADQARGAARAEDADRERRKQR
jgi:AbrB family looped-hinge helix DNA binding protein